MIQAAFHHSPEYFRNPSHPITVDLIGCGGTGSRVLAELAQLDTALIGLRHPGLHVRVFDPDIVSEANVARQRFFKSDVGQHKSTVLVSRVNRAYGLEWESLPIYYNETELSTDKITPGANIVVSCVDSGAARVSIGKINANAKLSRKRVPSWARSYYWLDFGNGKASGQVVLGTLEAIPQPKSKKTATVEKLQTVTELFPEIAALDNADDTPSCSTFEALSKQDLFTNAALVPFGMELIWQLLREGRVQHCGAYINIGMLNTNAVNVRPY